MQLKKYLASVSYDGSDYSGFTRSKDKPTIQDEIEKALTSIFAEKKDFNLDIKCASRTDARVHAISQLIVFLLPFNIIPCEKLTDLINLRLPSSIRFNWIVEIYKDFSLYSHVLNKEYIYILSKKPISPFTSRYIYYFGCEFDFEKLRNIFLLFEGEHDFSIFSKDSKQYKSTICNLYSCQVLLFEEKNLIIFYLMGNRFLYNMVRRLVGCTLSLSASNINSLPVSFEDFFSSPYSKFTTRKAPPNGLYLLRVNLVNL